MRNTKLAVRLCAAFAVLSQIGAVVAQNELEDQLPALGKIRVLLVTGGCCHDYENQKTILTSGIVERCRVPIEWNVVHHTGDETGARIPLYTDAKWAFGFDVVIHNECAMSNYDAAWIERILAPHRAGIPAVLLHCSVQSYQTDKWAEFSGVKSIAREPERPMSVVNIDTSHPVMAGFGSTWSTPQGELLLIDKVWPTVSPLSHSLSPKREEFQINTWTNLYGPEQTRVFATSIGHHNETMLDPKYLDLVTRGMLWALEMDLGKVFRGNREAESAPIESPVESKQLSAFPNNLLIGKPAIASSIESGSHQALKANDGEHGSRWGASSAGRGEWWQVDLGEPTDLELIALHWEKNAPYQYRIDVSKDGDSFKTIVDKTENTAPSQIVSHEVNAPDTKLLRVTFISGVGGRGSLREVAAYSDRKAIRAIENSEAVVLNGKPEEDAMAKLENSKKGPIALPKGYRATIVAKVDDVRFVKSAGTDALFYSTPDKVVRCRDTNGDGKADDFQDFLPEIDSPRGIEWDGEWLYVACSPNLIAWRDSDGDGVADESRTLASDLPINGLTLAIDGWLYGAIGGEGVKNGVGADGKSVELRSGGVIRIRPDGTDLHVFGQGANSLYDVAVSPTLDTFSRDEMNRAIGWDAKIHHFTGLNHHGYPNLFRYFPEEIVPPVASWGEGERHAVTWFDGQLVTADLAGDRVYRYEIEPYGGSFSEVGVSSFVEVPRPTDVEASLGSLLVASLGTSDGEGFIARITPSDLIPVPLPGDDVDDLILKLADSRAEVRLFASRALLRLTSFPAKAIIKLATDTEESAEVRMAAICTMAQSGDSGAASVVIDLITEGEVAVQRVAVRALDALPVAERHPAFQLLEKVTDPVLQRELIVAIVRSGNRDSSLAKLILEKTTDLDPLVSHTATSALVDLKASRTCLETLKDPAGYKLWSGAADVLGQIHEMPVVNGLIDRLKTTNSSVIRAVVIKSLARLRHREDAWNGDSLGERPDTEGPYISRATWEGTKSIDWELKKAFKDRRINKSFLLTELSRNHIPMESLTSVLDLTAIDPELEAATINMILAQEKVPEESLPFLTFIATNENRPGELRLRAATALSKTNDDLAIDEACRLVCASEGIESIPETREDLRRAFVENAAHANRYEWFIEQALDGGEDSSVLAWSVLIHLRGNKNACSEAIRKEIQAVLNTSRRNPAHLGRILAAIQQSDLVSGADLVRFAMQSSDETIRHIAEAIAKEFELKTS